MGFLKWLARLSAFALVSFSCALVVAMIGYARRPTLEQAIAHPIAVAPVGSKAVGVCANPLESLTGVQERDGRQLPCIDRPRH